MLAERGRRDEARAALNEAVSLYEGLDARWDIRRASSRLRPYGIRRGVRGPRGPRAASGWAALTPTEVKIAALVARGDSTSEIARGMFLSRRTVKTYISHILAKLGAKSRVEIVGEALRHGVVSVTAPPGARCRQMTTIHRPALAIPLEHGTQIRVGSMRELATRQAVPRELRPSGCPEPPMFPPLPPSGVESCRAARCSGGWPRRNASSTYRRQPGAERRC